MACLNSKFIKNYWKAKYSDNKALFPKIKGFQLKELPIPVTAKEQQIKIAALVETLLLEKVSEEDKNTRELEDTIDREIANLYGENL